MASQLTGRQVQALQARSTLSTGSVGRLAHGVRDAQNALAKIPDAHPNEHGELINALRAYLAEGPAWDSSDYEDGGAAVHDDVHSILDGDRDVINELLS